MPLTPPPDLTSNQTAIWLEQQLFAGRPIFNTGQYLVIRGNLNIDLFEEALVQTIAESPGLHLPPRSQPKPPKLLLLDFRKESDPDQAARHWMKDEMSRPIPLDGTPLFEFALLQVGDHKTVWFQKFHHIVIDATGRRLLSERVACRYRSLRYGELLAEVDASSPDEVLDAERQYLASIKHEDDRKYWLKRFAEWPRPVLEVDRGETERSRSGIHQRVHFSLARDDFIRLQKSAESLGSSSFRTLIALSYVAFARLYNRYDIVLGLELANRPDARTRQAIGLMAWPTPMLLIFDPSTTLAKVLKTIEEKRTQNYPHRRYSVQELARELEITRKGYHGLFDIIVNYIPAKYEFSFEETPVELINLSYGFTAPWIVTIADTGGSRDLDASIDFDSGLIPYETAAHLASSLEILLKRGFDAPESRLSDLPIMSAATRDQLMSFGAGDVVKLSSEETVASLCAAQAERTPNASAIIFNDEQFSFSEIHGQAHRLAGHLSTLGVRPGVIVGVALPRTPELIIAVLAIHKAGGAYLALDPSYPAERIQFIITDSSVRIIVTSAELAPAFVNSSARLVLCDNEIDDRTEDAALVLPSPKDLAYVLYTSGSTGHPKAATIEHRNLLNLISWGRSIVTDEELRGLLFSTSLNFDLSAFEMFVPLAFGGCMVIVENLFMLPSAPQREKVRLVNSGPSLVDALMRRDELPSTVTTIIVAGERLTRRTASAIFNTLPNVRLLNCYGPTETTVYSSWASIVCTDASEPTIGRPIWNTTFYVLDQNCASVPPGVEGELFIGGAGVCRGYYGRPDLTDSRFLPNPVGPGFLYRTGDRVRWRSDGKLQYLGRLDNQIKIHGVRIEPGEVESTLLDLPGIVAAIVVASEVAGTPRLIAYLVRSPEAEWTIEDVRDAVERRLPRAMVPSHFVWLDAMPLTPNGKVDQKGLPAPSVEKINRRKKERSETALERELAELWQDILQVSPVDVDLDFFDLGGDSLALVNLFASIDEKYGVSLTLDTLANGLTVKNLAQIVTENRSKKILSNSDPVVSLQPNGKLPPFFCIPGISGDVVQLQLLARRMGTRRPFYGLRHSSDLSKSEAVTEIAARHVDAILTRQTSGPYFIGGMSFGAAVAYEVAIQLEKQGHRVGLVAILDQRRPNWRFSLVKAIPVLHRILAAIDVRRELADVPRGLRWQAAWQLGEKWVKAAVGYREPAIKMLNLYDYDSAIIARCEANLRAYRAYRPERLQGALTLFRAQAQPVSHLVLDQTLGWSQLVKGKVRVRLVPGNHHTIRTEPFVRELAEALMQELDAVQVGSLVPAS